MADLDETAKFYEDLGFRPGERTDTSFKVYVNWFSIEFRLKNEKVDNAGIGSYTGIKVDNADEYYDFAVSKGIKPTTETADGPGGSREFTVTDPDGYKLVFFQKK